MQKSSRISNNQLANIFTLKPVLLIIVAAALSAYLTSLVPPALANENTHSSLSKARPAKKTKPNLSLRGWEEMYHLMVQNGADPKRLAKILNDKRMPKREPLHFRVKPRESTYKYRKHNTKKARANALKFYKKHRHYFEEAQLHYGVPQHVILAILQIESKCGKFTGKSRILPRLARLASAADKRNIDASYRKARKRNPQITRAQVAARAKWLQDTFLPHAIYTLELADKLEKHPLELRGSYAGALGLAQFLPANLETYGADANRDGAIDPFDPADAIVSVARFLKLHGWSDDTKTRKSQAKVIWHYNHSDAYVNTVLTMSKALKPQLEILEAKNLGKESRIATKPTAK